jgi:hypothetical protein
LRRRAMATVVRFWRANSKLQIVIVIHSRLTRLLMLNKLGLQKGGNSQHSSA